MACGCFKQWYKHKLMYIVMIVNNNHNYDFKGIINYYDRAALHGPQKHLQQMMYF